MNPEDDDAGDSWKPPDRQLGGDGQLIGGAPLAPAAPDAGSSPELVLDDNRAPRPAYVAPGPYRVAVREQRPWKWVLALLVLGGGVLGLFATRSGLLRSLPLPAVTKGTVMIFSDPPGATVRVGDRIVGVTPWAADNFWAGEANYEVSAPGRQSRRGTFHGGAEVELNLTLAKQKAR